MEIYGIEFDEFSGILLTTILILCVGFLLSDFPGSEVHPLLLSFQASVSRVRKRNESGIHRHPSFPNGFPLLSGLRIRKGYTLDDGDLRDVFQICKSGSPLSTLHGNDTTQISWRDVEVKMHAIGSFLKHRQVHKLAMRLPNSVENLIATFACSFYDITLVLISTDTKVDIGTVIKFASADSILLDAGAMNMDTSAFKSLKTVIVVDRGSQRMDFTAFNANVSLWREIRKSEVQPPETLHNEAVIVASDDELQAVYSYSHKHVIAAVAGQMLNWPKQHQMNEKDVFMSTQSFDCLQARIVLYAAMASRAKIILSSVAGHEVDLSITKLTNASVVFARLHEVSLTSLSHRVFSTIAARYVMHNAQPPRWTTPCKEMSLSSDLRIIFVPVLSRKEMLTRDQLRKAHILTGARFVVDLSDDHCVAGGIFETSLYDHYADREANSVGAPMPCVEAKTCNDELFVRGPAVNSNNWTKTSWRGEFLPNGTFVPA